MSPLLAKPKCDLCHPGLEFPSMSLTSWDPGKPSLSPTGAMGQRGAAVCPTAKGAGSRDGTGEHGAGPCWWLVHGRVRNTKQPSPGFCRPGAN